MAEWSEDAAFWEAMEPALCARARLALAEADVSGMLAWVRPRPNARVLDMGCGPGAHAIAVARHGHRVTGVDTSRRLLERARATAQGAGADVEWIEADMREFRRLAHFDLICSLYASFGYFDDAQNQQVLENFQASLVPGGALILDVVGREATAGPQPQARAHEIEGVRYLERRATVDRGSWLVTHWSVMRGETRQEFTARQRLYAAAELEERLLAASFATVDLAGSLDGRTPCAEGCERLVALARRPN